MRAAAIAAACAMRSRPTSAACISCNCSICQKHGALLDLRAGDQLQAALGRGPPHRLPVQQEEDPPPLLHGSAASRAFARGAQARRHRDDRDQRALPRRRRSRTRSRSRPSTAGAFRTRSHHDERTRLWCSSPAGRTRPSASPGRSSATSASRRSASAYGQRHAAELGQRETLREGLKRINALWAERLGPDHMLELPELGRLSDTALTRDAEIEMTAAGLPSTFVPGRNLLFFTYAAALAYRRAIAHARRRHVRDRLFRLSRLPQRDDRSARQGHLARHG